MSEPVPLQLDLADFDAVGIAADAVVTVRAHAIERSLATAATVSAPDAWHRVIVNASPSGQTLLKVRLTDLTNSRANNVTKALRDRGWHLDEDGDGLSHRHPAGTDATTVAFDLLAALTTAGAPSDVRTVTAVDAEGTALALGGTDGAD